LKKPDGAWKKHHEPLPLGHGASKKTGVTWQKNGSIQPSSAKNA
jgi:hypothetical protein